MRVSSVSAPAHATSFTFGATLTGGAESPPTLSTATGSALVTFDDVLLTVAVSETFAGLAAPATASHIHCCTNSPGLGNVGVFLGLTGFPSATSGTYRNTFTLTSSSFSTLLTGANAGEAYVNVHDSIYPGGEIRGFLAAVPEPGTYALMLAGLAMVGGLARNVKRA